MQFNVIKEPSVMLLVIMWKDVMLCLLHNPFHFLGIEIPLESISKKKKNLIAVLAPSPIVVSIGLEALFLENGHIITIKMHFNLIGGGHNWKCV